MLRITFTLAMLLGTGLCSGAPTEIRGVAGTDDVTGKLTRQVAALEARLNQLEKAQAAITRRLDKVDVSDDGSGDDTKKTPGKSKGDAQPDKGQGNGSAGSGGGAGKSSGDLNNVPGKPGTPNRVVAPFVVIDKAGKVIFRVQDPDAGGGEGGGDRGIYVFEETGKTVAQLVASHGGGKLKVQKVASDTYVATAANNDAVGSIVRQDGKQRAFMGVASNNGGVMAVFGADGAHAAAGMQLSQGGGGLVAVFKNDVPISFLTESTTHPGGGNVTTTDPGGRGVFSAGYDGDLGAACVGHKGALHCLGIGLPLGGGN